MKPGINQWLLVGLLFLLPGIVRAGELRTRLPAISLPNDETLAYDDGTVRTWWVSDKDSFGVAVRFTPSEYPCDVLSALGVVHYEDGMNIYLRVYDDLGPSGKPGNVLYEEHRTDIPNRADSSYHAYDLSAPVTIDSGDFYVCFWQKQLFNLVFASDQAMNYPTRQWWFFPGQGWVAPSGLDAADHLIRALVREGTGIEELTPNPGPTSDAASISPNPCTGLLHVRLPTGTASAGRIRLFDAAGRDVKDVAIARPSTGGTQTLDLHDLPSGAYLVRIETGSLVSMHRLVLRR